MFDLEKELDTYLAAFVASFDPAMFRHEDLFPPRAPLDAAERDAVLQELSAFHAAVKAVIPTDWWNALHCRVQAQIVAQNYYKPCLLVHYDDRQWVFWKDHDGVWRIKAPESLYDLGGWDEDDDILREICDALGAYRAAKGSARPPTIALERTEA